MISIKKTTGSKGNIPAFHIHAEAQLLNLSKDSYIDLKRFSSCISNQINSVYNFDKQTYSCSVSINIEIIHFVKNIDRYKLLFCIMDEVRNGNPAEADFKGLRIALNNAIVEPVLSGNNTRTLPHELGHIFGWEHPHARGKYESINPDANKLFEQSMTEAERKINLMSQTWYIQTAGLNSNEGLNITFGQLELMYKNFQAKKLNNNYHLKGMFWWKKLV